MTDVEKTRILYIDVMAETQKGAAGIATNMYKTYGYKTEIIDIKTLHKSKPRNYFMQPGRSSYYLGVHRVKVKRYFGNED